MRVIFWIIVTIFPVLAAPAAENGRGESGIKNLLTKHKTWTMYWELTDAERPGERATKLKYDFFERDQKLMARMIVEYGGCEFEVPLRADGIELRYCSLPGEPGPCAEMLPTRASSSWKSKKSELTPH
ncbi:MAG: hypothetical protein EHM67_07710 [Hyphomicrobiaceae bacterium]|nr:MAG: hypothetical protein EHM67_07710 [Hyphomicrobiaceae bacterium]